jgi:hypothetical protein
MDRIDNYIYLFLSLNFSLFIFNSCIIQWVTVV